jgi:hypothetical protein
MPAKAAKVTTTATHTLRVDKWKTFSLPQGVHFDGLHYYVSQARMTGRGNEQDTIIHRYTAAGVYRDCMTLPKAGHCSTFGIRKIDANRTNVYVRWDQTDAKGKTKATPVARMLYRPGTVKWGDDSVAVLPGLSGGPSVDAKAMTICTRTVNALGIETWKIYNLDAISRTNKAADPLATFRTPKASGNFQGHLIHGASLFRQYGSTGKPSQILEHTWRDGKKVRKIDTHAAAPTGEPEGLFMRDGALYFCKRVGGVNADRRLLLFRVDL